MDRKNKLKEYIKYWQIRLSLQSWDIKVEYKDFNRTDYPQSGDIDINLDDKKATIFLLDKETGIDKKIILHELIHLLLWDLDIYSEKHIPDADKPEYFGKLEKTVENLTNIILHQDK